MSIVSRLVIDETYKGICSVSGFVVNEYTETRDSDGKRDQHLRGIPRKLDACPRQGYDNCSSCAHDEEITSTESRQYRPYI